MEYTYGLGRRKTATARVRLFAGKGNSEVNGKPLKEYVTRDDLLSKVHAPLKIAAATEYHFSVVVSGSGESAQAHAIAHGIARALVKIDETFKSALREQGLLTRDARKVERKKPGLHKARKRIQWSKR
ncbi:30S ribosomal protein S9 [Candidatus Gracilibacteria bacterium]|mgnify:CR=1 FL=1|nr:30S ribosomal protein S9 [Candidatus Gracilibacteria bacterium]